MTSETLLGIAPYLIPALIALLLAILFRNPLLELIRRIRGLDYESSSGAKLHIEADAVSTLPTPDQSTEPPLSKEQNPTVEVRLPLKLYQDLVGRRTSIQDGLNALRSPQYAIVGISGSGGVGKTALARELADFALEEGLFVSAIWISAKRTSFEPLDQTIGKREKVTFESIFQEIVAWLGAESEFGNAGIGELRARLKSLMDTSPYLVIVDNLETANDDQNDIAKELRYILGNSKAILTSRNRWEPEPLLYPIYLKGLSETSSIELMQSLSNSPRVQKASQEEMLSLVKQVGCAPLALKLITSWLEDHDIPSVQQALKAGFLQFGDMYRYIYLRTWRKLPANSQQLLLALVEFDQDSGAARQDLQQISELNISDFSESIQLLTKHHMIEVAGDLNATRYMLHPLTVNFLTNDLLRI